MGFIATYPMNYWLVAIGWKHGQGREHMLKETEVGQKKQQHQGREAHA